MRVRRQSTEVDESRFADLAEELGITPEEAVETVLNKMKDLPWPVKGEARRKSLDKALGALWSNAYIAHVWGEEIRKVIGDREYFVGDGAVDLQKGTGWHDVDFLTGDDSEINGVHLQFGQYTWETVSASVDVVLDDGKLDDEAVEKIYELAYFVAPDEDFPVELEQDYDDGRFSFSIMICTTHHFSLPEFSEVNDMVKKAKEIIRAQGSRPA